MVSANAFNSERYVILSIATNTFTPPGVVQSPFFTMPKLPLPSFPYKNMEDSGIRHVRACSLCADNLGKISLDFF